MPQLACDLCIGTQKFGVSLGSGSVWNSIHAALKHQKRNGPKHRSPFVWHAHLMLSQFACHLYIRTQEFEAVLGSSSLRTSIHAWPNRFVVHAAYLNPGTQNGPKLRELFGCCQHLMMFQFACLLCIRTQVFGAILVSNSLWNSIQCHIEPSSKGPNVCAPCWSSGAPSWNLAFGLLFLKW